MLLFWTHRTNVRYGFHHMSLLFHQFSIASKEIRDLSKAWNLEKKELLFSFPIPQFSILPSSSLSVFLYKTTLWNSRVTNNTVNLHVIMLSWVSNPDTGHDTHKLGCNICAFITPPDATPALSLLKRFLQLHGKMMLFYKIVLNIFWFVYMFIFIHLQALVLSKTCFAVCRRIMPRFC